MAADVRLDGLVGVDTKQRGAVLLRSDTRGETSERFRLARAAFFPVSRGLSASPRLLTGSGDRAQRSARAFAAELLAPTEALARRVSGSLDDRDLEALAAEFVVSPMVIRHQIENHHLGAIDT